MQGIMEKTQNLTLKIKKLDNFVSIPEYKTQGASAMDLVAAIDEDIIIPAGEIRIIPLGLRLSFRTTQKHKSARVLAWQSKKELPL